MPPIRFSDIVILLRISSILLLHRRLPLPILPQIPPNLPLQTIHLLRCGRAALTGLHRIIGCTVRHLGAPGSSLPALRGLPCSSIPRHQNLRRHADMLPFTFPGRCVPEHTCPVPSVPRSCRCCCTPVEVSLIQQSGLFVALGSEGHRVVVVVVYCSENLNWI